MNAKKSGKKDEYLHITGKWTHPEKVWVCIERLPNGKFQFDVREPMNAGEADMLISQIAVAAVMACINMAEGTPYIDQHPECIFGEFIRRLHDRFHEHHPEAYHRGLEKKAFPTLSEGEVKH